MELFTMLTRQLLSPPLLAGAGEIWEMTLLRHLAESCTSFYQVLKKK